jgi:hypothetical protein
MKIIKTLTSLSRLVPVGREKGDEMRQFKLPQVASRFVGSLAILGLVGLMPSGGSRTVQAIEPKPATVLDAINGITRKDTAYHVIERAPVGAKASRQLGSIRNEVAATLLPGTRYDNIVNIGCGWASGVNFTSSYDWPSLLPSIMSNPLTFMTF